MTLSIEDFGTGLVNTGDLDPIYLMLNAIRLDRNVRAKWCLAYWMFYHAGVSCLLAEAPDFWAAVRRADVEKWPRGTERRHFRGAASRNSIAYLSDRFENPESAVYDLLPHDTIPSGGIPYTYVMRRAMNWVGFGPWIAFKIADMLDATLGVKVDFTGSESAFFDDPVLGAYAYRMGADLPHAREDFDADGKAQRAFLVKGVVDELLAGPLGKLPSPTVPNRQLAIQEVETILCKWKSHLNGHYEIGKDTREILHGLEPYLNKSKLSSQMYNALLLENSRRIHTP